MNFDTQSSHVFFLEFTRQVPLDERRLTDSTVSDEDQLELGNLFMGLSLYETTKMISGLCARNSSLAIASQCMQMADMLLQKKLCRFSTATVTGKPNRSTCLGVIVALEFGSTAFT